MEQPPPGYYPPAPQQQQQQQQTTVVVVNQPSATSVTLGQQQNIREWSTGLCGCFEDIGSCCYAWWCHPCFLCSLAVKMDENCCGPICCGGGSIYGCTSNPNLFLVAMRAKLRAQYGIKGDICNDVCCLWCCPFCAATQMWREVKHVRNA